MERLVVVGASLAGLRAAQAARAAGFDGELVIIGDEPHLPYTRPPLSKELLKIQAVGFPALAEHLEIVEQAPDGRRLVAVGAHAGRVIGVVAFNAARRLAWYRRALAQPPELDLLREQVLADESNLGVPAAPTHAGSNGRGGADDPRFASADRSERRAS